MNAPRTAVEAGKKRFHSLRWQRVPVAQMGVRDPRREALLWIGYSTFYVFLSAMTGLLIRHQFGRDVAFTQTAWYMWFFKIGGLLALPLFIFHRQGYRARDLLFDWRPNARQFAWVAVAFGIGVMVNFSLLSGIIPAAQQFSISELAVRLAAGIFLPLITAGVPEEVVYRGILQTRLEAVLGRLGAVLLQGALFAAWHFPSRYLLANGVEGHAGNAGSVMMGTVLPVFAIGIIFGVLWDRYRRLPPLVALHWGVDTLPFLSGQLGIHF